MTSGWNLLPQGLFIVPLIAAAVLFFWKTTTSFRRKLATTFLIINLLLSFFSLYASAQGVVTTVLVGGWVAPHGIVLVVDALSALMLFSVNFVFLGAVLYGFCEESVENEKIVKLPLLFFLQAGVALTLMTGDFFNLFVAVEVMLTASYALMVISVSPEKLHRAFSYVILSMMASFLFIVLAGMIYGYTGHLNMAAISLALQGRGGEPAVIAMALLALLIFGLKAGVFPLYFWLPDSYPILPSGLAALFGGVLTKVGVYILIRLFVTVFPHNLDSVYLTAGVLAGFTMLLGVIGAVGKETIKGVLSYHILSQTGYMIFAAAMLTPKAIAGGIYFVIHNVWTKSSLFMLGGFGKRFFKTDSIEKMGGLWQAIPFAGTLFFIQAMSLAGIPPFSGFWGKYLVLAEGINQGHWWLVIIGALTGFLTLFSMVKIWTLVYMGPLRQDKKPIYVGLLGSSLILVICSLTLAFGAQYAVEYIDNAGVQLFDSQQYVEAVYSIEGKGKRL